MTPLLSYALFFLSLILSQSKLVIGEIIPSSSAFDFIKRLEGSKNGDKVKGLYNLKKYLKIFGYIDDLSYNNHSNEADYFSDQLESALRTYQNYFNLNSTGFLDADTVSQMMKPRCGVPDIINGTKWIPHYSFLPGMPKWPDNKRVLEYRFARGTPIKFFFPVKKALKQWHYTGRFSFKKTSSRVADLTFQLFARDHGDGYPFDGPGGIFAHSFAPQCGICHFDSEENWVKLFDPPPNGLDIQSVALHEIGHLLGLGHNSIPNAVMWPSFDMGEKKRVLRYDDMQGIRDLYRGNENENVLFS